MGRNSFSPGIECFTLQGWLVSLIDWRTDCTDCLNSGFFSKAIFQSLIALIWSQDVNNSRHGPNKQRKKTQNKKTPKPNKTNKNHLSVSVCVSFSTHRHMWPGCSGTHSIDQAVLELWRSACLLPESWAWRHVPPLPVYLLFYTPFPTRIKLRGFENILRSEKLKKSHHWRARKAQLSLQRSQVLFPGPRWQLTASATAAAEDQPSPLPP